jgi:hypothetical protein
VVLVRCPASFREAADEESEAERGEGPFELPVRESVAVEATVVAVVAGLNGSQSPPLPGVPPRA